MRRSQQQQGSDRSRHLSRPKKRTGLGPHLGPQIRGVSQGSWGYVRSSEIDVVRRIPLSEPWVFTHVNVRVLGDIAFVDGVQSGAGEFHLQASKGLADKFVFMRNYVRRQGRWQLLTFSLSYVNDENSKRLDPNSLYR